MRIWNAKTFKAKANPCSNQKPEDSQIDSIHLHFIAISKYLMLCCAYIA